MASLNLKSIQSSYLNTIDNRNGLFLRRGDRTKIMAVNLIQNAGIIKNYEDQFLKDPAHPLQDVSPKRFEHNHFSVVRKDIQKQQMRNNKMYMSSQLNLNKDPIKQQSLEQNLNSKKESQFKSQTSFDKQSNLLKHASRNHRYKNINEKMDSQDNQEIEEILSDSQSFAQQNLQQKGRSIFRINRNIPFKEKFKKEAQLGLMSLESAVDLLKSQNLLNDQLKFPKIRNLIKNENQYSRFGKNKEDNIYKTNEKNDVFLTEESVEYQMNKYIKKNGVELRQQLVFSRESFSDFILKHYGVQLSQMMMTEAMIACKGKDQNDSDINPEYDQKKLIRWTIKNLPSLIYLEKYKSKRRNKERNSLQLQNIESVQKSVDSITIAQNSDRDQSQAVKKEEQPKMKQVGNSLYIINNKNLEDQLEYRKRINNANFLTDQLKNKISDCLEQADKKPSMRKKLLESMYELEQQLNMIRAEEGYLAQIKAQQRVRQSLKAIKEKEEKDLENMLERTAVLDSAVRAVSLQKLLVPSWNEEKNSYILMSKITEKQNKRLELLLESK